MRRTGLTLGYSKTITPSMFEGPSIHTDPRANETSVHDHLRFRADGSSQAAVHVPRSPWYAEKFAFSQRMLARVLGPGTFAGLGGKESKGNFGPCRRHHGALQKLDRRNGCVAGSFGS